MRSAWSAEPEPPADLDALTALAITRHPEALALYRDAEAARARATAAGRPMDPQWMLGVRSIGAMPDSADPMMAMVGIEQMFALPGVYRASRDRAELEARWAEAAQARVAADLRLTLWEAAARLRAQDDEGRALDEQIAAAEAALALGRARYGAGSGGVPPVSPEAGVQSGAPPALPTVVAPSGGGMGGGMGSMGAMGGAGGTGTMGAMAGAGGMGSGDPAEMGAAMGGMGGGMSPGMATPMAGEGLAALLRLDAEIARARADRDGLQARRAGEMRRLTLIVGDEAARVVAADPGRFVGARAPRPTSSSPERTLAATATEIAAADLAIAKSARLPTFMVATDVQIMPEGMVNGVDVEVGVTVPLWGGAGARVDAASAASAATSRRSELVDRELAQALASAEADLAAAEARFHALAASALPRARAAWDASLAVWSAGGGSSAELVSAWQAEVAVTRDAIDAALAAELARARLERLEGS